MFRAADHQDSCSVNPGNGRNIICNSQQAQILLAASPPLITKVHGGIGNKRRIL